LKKGDVMKKVIASRKTIKKPQQERFRKARKNLEKMEEVIAPFIRRSEIRRRSPSGQWLEESSLYQ